MGIRRSMEAEDMIVPQRLSEDSVSAPDKCLRRQTFLVAPLKRNEAVA